MQNPVRLTCLIENMAPTLFAKDVGQIPLQLAVEMGWTCELAYCAPNAGEFSVPEEYEHWVRTVALSTSRARTDSVKESLRFLARRAKEIDVLLVYHLTSESVLFATAFKAMNKSGVAVLKLDMDHRGLAAFDERASLKQRVLLKLFSAAPFDLVTVESEQMFQELAPHLSRFGHRLRLFPNGIVVGRGEIEIDRVIRNKENVVLTAGRLGLFQKNNELLLRAIESLRIATLGDWRFWFVGCRTTEFEEATARMCARRPDLAPKVVLMDFVESRDELAEIYKRARVYCLTSRWESYALVLAEASYYGCYLISTKVGAAPELTNEGEWGTLLDSDDPQVLATVLERILTDDMPIDEASRLAHENVRANYTWPLLVRGFAQDVNEVISKRPTSGRTLRLNRSA